MPALLTPDPLATLHALYQQELEYLRTHQIERYFPDTGPYRRELYPKHLEFFAAGKTHMLRLFSAGNRIGKSKAGCTEDTYHLTGLYPHWWEGRRFDAPVKIWVCGTTDEKIKESVQEELLGPVNAMGTGLIPEDCLAKRPDMAAGSIKDLVDTIWVTHHDQYGTPDGVSQCTFKSYKQGRQAFEATRQDVIHNDEEVPIEIHNEEVIRLADTTGRGQDGILYNTVTPLLGLSATMAFYMPDGQIPEGPQTGNTYVVQATWDDVPHLSEATKATLRAGIPAYQLDARSRGIPVLGAGVIFPVAESSYIVDPFELPKHWRRCYGLDVGWRVTGGPFGAYDVDTDTWYLYHEYYGKQEQPSSHAAAMRAPGEWIPGVIDPAANGRSQDDGSQLFAKYSALGLKLTFADNAREAGLYEIWERLSTGRLKVFSSLVHWRREVRTFRRNEKGQIVQEQDYHMMAATRYLLMSGRQVAKAVPVPQQPQRSGQYFGTGRGGWMAR